MRIYYLLIIVLVALFLTSCTVEETANEYISETNYTNTKQGGTMLDVRYDTEELEEWFPNLKGIVSAEWESYPQGEDNYSFVPGPSSYISKGIIVLSEDKANEYMRAYKWDSVVPDVDFKYVPTGKLDGVQWLSSWYFDHNFRPQSFNGYFWFDGERVLFSVSK